MIMVNYRYIRIFLFIVLGSLFLWLIFIKCDSINTISQYYVLEDTKTDNSWRISLTPNKPYCYQENNSTIIFFHLTNTSDHWTPLEMCAFKSASIMNPETGICVLSAYEMKEHPELVGIANLEFAKLNFTALFTDTPLKNWYDSFTSPENPNKKHLIFHISDALRYVYLYKYGGKYIDSDCIILRNLNNLRNVIGRESASTLASSVLIFDKGHPFLTIVMKYFTEYFTPNIWGSGGPTLLSKVHQNAVLNRSTYTILNSDVFFPIHYSHYLLPFQSNQTDYVKKKTRNSHSLHLWRQIFVWDNRTDIYTDPPPGSFVHEFLNYVCLQNGRGY